MPYVPFCGWFCLCLLWLTGASGFQLLPLAFLRGEEFVARGVFILATLSIVMTATGQTFHKNLLAVVSEDLLDNSERIVVDKFILTRIQYATKLHLVISRPKHVSRNRQRHDLLLTVRLRLQLRKRL